jgi:predicted transcriptional regulator
LRYDRRAQEEIIMLVKDIMTSNVRTVTSDQKLGEVVSLMCLYRYSGIPVVDDGKLSGIVAESDVLKNMFPKLEDLMDSMSAVNYDEQVSQYAKVVHLIVKDVMTRVVITISPDAHILQAASMMVGRKFRRIPVAVGTNLVGMVSLGDVHKAIFQSTIATRL